MTYSKTEQFKQPFLLALWYSGVNREGPDWDVHDLVQGASEGRQSSGDDPVAFLEPIADQLYKEP